MKRISKLIYFLSFLIIGSCNSNDGIRISIINQSETSDSLIIRNLITEDPILILPFSATDTLIELNEPVVVSISNSGSSESNSLLGILLPNRNKLLKIDSNSGLKSHCLADSLLHYLFISNNSFIGENQNLIFGAENPKDIYTLFESLITKRDSVINSYERSLTSTEKEILDFQNSARVYSFLFYYGRLIRDLSPRHSFWDYLAQIDNNSNFNKSLPQNLLYKYEIEYLKKHNELESIADFIDFIHLNTKNIDLANYLTAIYIKELVSNPYYWEKHNKLFESVTFLEILDEQKYNPYNEIYNRITELHLASQKGMVAYNFNAKDKGNLDVNLSDFEDKIVFIDVWATWCGACIAQKPYFYELATKFKDNNNIQFISISVDSSIDIWKKYLSNNDNNNEKVKELYIQNGMRTEFGERYLIKFVPKYILIDKGGIIIDSNAPTPSKQLELMLNDLLIRD